MTAVERFQELVNNGMTTFNDVNVAFADWFNVVTLSNKTYASTMANGYVITISSPNCIIDLDLNNGIVVRRGELDLDVVYMTIVISRLSDEMLHQPEKIGAFIAMNEIGVILRGGNSIFKVFKHWNHVTGHSVIAHQIAFEAGELLEDPAVKEETPVQERNPERIERRTRRLW